MSKNPPALIVGAVAITMTSLDLVDYINDLRGDSDLTHANFLAKVPKVLGEESHSFECDVPDAYGRPRRAFRFPKREACLMAMSYSYELQAKVYDHMTELEASAAGKVAITVPQTMAQALRLAADQAEQIEQQQLAIAAAKPAVAFVERYVQAGGLKGFRETCKLLKANEARFREFVIANKIMYRLGSALTAHQNHIDAGRFEVRTGHAEANDHAFTSTKFTAKGIDWIAGEWAKHQLAQRGDV